MSSPMRRLQQLALCVTVIMLMCSPLEAKKASCTYNGATYKHGQKWDGAVTYDGQSLCVTCQCNDGTWKCDEPANSHKCGSVDFPDTSDSDNQDTTSAPTAASPIVSSPATTTTTSSTSTTSTSTTQAPVVVVVAPTTTQAPDTTTSTTSTTSTTTQAPAVIVVSPTQAPDTTTSTSTTSTTTTTQPPNVIVVAPTTAPTVVVDASPVSSSSSSTGVAAVGGVIVYTCATYHLTQVTCAYDPCSVSGKNFTFGCYSDSCGACRARPICFDATQCGDDAAVCYGPLYASGKKMCFSHTELVYMNVTSSGFLSYASPYSMTTMAAVHAVFALVMFWVVPLMS